MLPFHGLVHIRKRSQSPAREENEHDDERNGSGDLGGQRGAAARTRLHVGLWVAQGLLAAAFGVAGLTHATRPIAEMAKMAPWTGALPEGLVRFIGVVELAGALGWCCRG